MNTLNLKPLDILLYKGKGFRSWLIQFGTKSPYNHVAVAVDPRIGLGIESNTGSQEGVRAFDLRKLNSEEVDVFRLKSGHEVRREEAVAFLVDRLGRKFDWIGVTWLGVLKTLGLVTFFRFKPYNAFQRERDYFCSELCYEAFMEGKVDIVPQVDSAATVSPGDIGQSPVLEKVENV